MSVWDNVVQCYNFEKYHFREKRGKLHVCVCVRLFEQRTAYPELKMRL